MTGRALALLLLLAASPARPAPDLSADALLRDHLWREVRKAPEGRRPKVGLVLSAGSLRATAHIGVIEVLENAGFPIDVVAGTSMGAVIGSFYASGVPVRRMRDFAETLRLGVGTNLSSKNLISLVLFDKLLSSENTEKLVRGFLGGLRFDQTKKPFACVAMDVYTGEAIIFRDGEIAPAVRASMNLPGIFAPVEYRHRYLVDGGVVDYIPVDAAKLLGAEWTLASVTENDYTAVRPKNVLDALEQVIDIRGSYLARDQKRQADVVIEPAVGDIGMFQDHRITEALEKGSVAAARRLAPAQDSLILSSLPRLLEGWRGPEKP